MKFQISLSSLRKRAILEKLSTMVPPIAKSVSLRIFVSSEDVAPVRKWKHSFGFGEIPIECAFVFDDEEKVGTAIVSVDLPRVSVMIPKDHQAFKRVMQIQKDIFLYGSLIAEGDPVLLCLTLNGKPGYDLYLELSDKYMDLVFHTVDE